MLVDIDINVLQEFFNRHDIQAEAIFDDGKLYISEEVDSGEEIWDLNDSDPWYMELWEMNDLYNAMREAEVPLTEENIDKALNAVKGIFDDYSDRNEMLLKCIENTFKNE